MEDWTSRLLLEYFLRLANTEQLSNNWQLRGYITLQNTVVKFAEM